MVDKKKEGESKEKPKELVNIFQKYKVAGKNLDQSEIDSVVNKYKKGSKKSN